MPVPSKADNNVPFLANRSRYQVVTTAPTWCYHKMAAGQALTGEAPQTATVVAANLDPVVISGRATYSSLIKGGLFTLQANARKNLLVEALDNQAGAAVTIVARDGSTSRNAPSTYPFKVGASEVIKALGGTTGGYIGVLYRIDGQEIW